MNKLKSNIFKQLLTSFLSLAIVLSTLPYSPMVYAETASHSNAVTIVVKDENGTPINGANVTYKVDNLENASIIGETTKTTDVNGEVVILDSSVLGTSTGILTATITGDHYETHKITAAKIVTGKENFDVSLKSTLISDVNIQGKKLTYNGNNQELVLITGAENDTVTYELDGQAPISTIPTGKDAKNYSVRVTVKRDGKEDFIETVESQILPAAIEGVKVTPVSNLKFDGKKHELVTVEGTLPTDKLTWSVNDVASAGLPQASAIGSYNIKLEVLRDDNHEKLEINTTSEIGLGELDLGNLLIKPNSRTYDTTTQPALKVTGDNGDLTIQYRVGTTNEWVDEIPELTNAGHYEVFVKISKVNYEEVIASYNVDIAKAKQDIEFNPEAPSKFDISTSEQREFDYHVIINESAPNNKPVYRLVGLSTNDATIDTNGKITLKTDHASMYIVEAKLSATENYEEAVVAKKFNVLNGGTTFYFPNSTKTYRLSTNNNLPSQTMIKVNPQDNGEVTYSITGFSTKESGKINEGLNKTGVEIDEKTGDVTIVNREDLINLLKINGIVRILIKGEKADGKIRQPKIENDHYVFDENGDMVYEEVVISRSGYENYVYIITYGETPTFDKSCEKSEPDVTGWYNQEHQAIITAKPGYEVALDPNGPFSANVTLPANNPHEVYIHNTTNDQISGSIPVDAEIDYRKPELSSLKIEFSEPFVEINNTGYYDNKDKMIEITFTANDVESGIDHFDWYYTKEANVSAVNSDDFGGRINVTNNKGVAAATLKLTENEAKQLHGRISFTATDAAGNISDLRNENHVIIVDSISPTSTFTLTDAINEVDNHKYFNQDVKCDLVINEANFDNQDVKVKIAKNGATPKTITPTWTTNVDGTIDEHQGTFTLSGDGDYVVTIEYTDKSHNKMETYTSDTITIDTIKPVLSATVDQVNQKVTFNVKEHNFDSKSIELTGTITDITGSAVALTPEQLTTILHSSDWTSIGNDTYQFVYAGNIDGIYNLKMDYQDVVKFDAKQFVIEEFVIDHSVPTDVEIEIVTNPIAKVVEGLTLGFYKPNVEIRFTAFDKTSGIKSFNWEYKLQDDASVSNLSNLSDTVAAIQDKTDKTKYTATIKLPTNAIDQIRGFISAQAVDASNNKGAKVTEDGTVIIVDTIAPHVEVEFNPADHEHIGTNETVYYYNKNIDVTLNITEANFYAEDVKVELIKDKGTPITIEPIWGTMGSNDTIKGQFTIPAESEEYGDGEYVVKVSYQDKSQNSDDKSSYASSVMVIDTTKPVIKVDYKNTNLINCLEDLDGHDRNYFGDTQTAVVTITEKNFDPERVNFAIAAQDVTGKQLNVQELHTKADWEHDESTGEHKLTITYPGDANYTFDVDAVDLATNASEDYETDYFTVDKTAPDMLDVKYSDNVIKNTILEAITFGFYNSKVTVTISATDNISPINQFVYSYKLAEGVSNVNAGLTGEIISENLGKILTQSNSGKASTTFTIPKDVLDSKHQFNGTVEFEAVNRAGQRSIKKEDTKRIIVDNIKPVAKVNYNDAKNNVNDIFYYDGDINANLLINEANFYKEDVKVSYTKDDEGVTSVNPSWTDKNADEHEGTFKLSGDGDYVITIDHKDKSDNAMETYVSKHMIIDTKIEEPTFSINGATKLGNAGAYSKDITVGFAYADQNFDEKTIQLIRTKFNKSEDVTEQFIKINGTENGGSGEFSIPATVENDGIFVLKISFTDKAKHTAESEIKFIVNRFGSVYEYGDYLVSLIKDGGQYVKIENSNKAAVSEDLIITEYNASEISEEELQILITRDGEKIETIYNRDANVGATGWNEYIYTISKDNFKQDGVYKITLTSSYATNDASKNDSTSIPDNSIDLEGNQILDAMTFTVDTTCPEIRNIVNLDQNIVNAQTLDVKYTVVDTGGLKSIQIYVDGEIIEEINEFEDVYNYAGQFTISESNEKQTIRIIVTDIAGNVTDTASEDFNSEELYIFNDEITVSTNFFVRWYANKPLFWGSMLGVVALILIIIILIIKHKDKDEEQN